MIAVYSSIHRSHAPERELAYGGFFGQAVEIPERAEIIYKEMETRNGFDIREPEAFPDECLEKIHDPRYLEFLSGAWQEWHDLGREGDAFPAFWAVGSLRGNTPPVCLDGRLGYYSFSCDSAITRDTWRAAKTSALIALTGMKHIIDGAGGVFSLCRPPGHHAARDLLGGYCYLNNAAIAAQYALDQGSKRIALLDIDYHHGNGTQDIFYSREDVLYLSIHADPRFIFPFYTGYEREKGSGNGEGFNANYPLRPGADRKTWFQALEAACRRMEGYEPDVCIISLGVDTYEKDPLTSFKLQSEDFLRVGKRIAGIRRPTLFVMEGGYAVDAVGINVCNVLEGFQGVYK